MKKITRLETIFNIVSLTLFSGAGIALFERLTGFNPSENLGDGNRLTQILLLFLYSISIYFLFRVKTKNIVQFLLNEKVVLLLSVFIILSVFWSDFPSISFRRSVALTLTTIYGTYFGFRFNFAQQIILLKVSLGIGILLSVVLCILYPGNEAFVHQVGAHVGSWKGLFFQKNAMGLASVFSSLLCAVSLLDSKSSFKEKTVDLVLFCLSFFAVVMTNSKTALVVLLVMLLLILLFRRLQRFPSSFTLLALISGIFLSGIILIFLVSNFELFTTALGKNPTLSGRTDLWSLVLVKISQRPLLGYGFSGFWLADLGESYEIWLNFNWLPNHAHNGWLDIALDLGWVGLLIFMVGFSLCGFRSLVYLSNVKQYAAIWPLALITTTVMTNVTYSTYLKQHDLLWVAYVAICLRLTSEINLFKNQKE